jgi:hypothetical protein
MHIVDYIELLILTYERIRPTVDIALEAMAARR